MQNRYLQYPHIGVEQRSEAQSNTYILQTGQRKQTFTMTRSAYLVVSLIVCSTLAGKGI